MDADLLDRTLIWLYSETDAYTFESFESYSPKSFFQLHLSVSQFIENQLDEFYANFSEWFNMAEFPDVEEQLLPSKTAVFLKGARTAIDSDVTSVEGQDRFSGLWAVIRHRLDQRSLEQVELAAELFNWTIEFGLLCCDTSSCAVVRVGSIEEVAPLLLERVLSGLCDGPEYGYPANQRRLSRLEQKFLPLAPVLKMLKETVDSGNWIHNQLAVGIFFWIADTYNRLVLNGVG